jgi:hypothetical protein
MEGHFSLFGRMPSLPKALPYELPSAARKKRGNFD